MKTMRKSIHVFAISLVANGCASTVVPSDGNGSDVMSSNDVLHGTDVTGSDAPPITDAGPMRCAIAGSYATNGGLIMQLVLGTDGSYTADGRRFVGTYTWNGQVLSFTPGPGSGSNECAARYGSSVNVTFDSACRQALVVTATDNCTGSGLLTTSSNITRL
jgi:hypothetical protein